MYLDGICSIPVSINKKVANVGKTLFSQFFIDANSKKIKTLSLSAVQDGPFDVTKKYENLGFKKDITTYPYTKMECNKYEISKQYSRLLKEIEYEKCNSEHVRLDYLLD